MEKEKVLGLLGDSSSLLLVKGQIRNIQRLVKETGEPYYLADIRFVKTMSDSAYGINFNTAHVCFSTDFVTINDVTDDSMRVYKDNECLFILSLSSRIDTVKKDDKTFKFNKVQYFVEDIELLNQIHKPTSANVKVVNI